MTSRPDPETIRDNFARARAEVSAALIERDQEVDLVPAALVARPHVPGPHNDVGVPGRQRPTVRADRHRNHHLAVDPQGVRFPAVDGPELYDLSRSSVRHAAGDVTNACQRGWCQG